MLTLLYLLSLLSIAEEPKKEDIVQDYIAREKQWHQEYIQKMRIKPLGERTKGYLDTFVYRTIQPSSPQGLSTLDHPTLYNNILGESYFPFFTVHNDIRQDVIEIIPEKWVSKVQKNPSWWFSKKKKARISIYRSLKNTTKKVIISLVLGKEIPPQWNKNNIIFHVRNTSADSPQTSHRYSKYIVDYLIEHDLDFETFIIDSTQDNEELAQSIQSNIIQYFQRMPEQPQTIIFRDNQHTFSFRYELFLKKGALWIRSKQDFVGRKEAWYKLGAEFLPQKIQIKEISTDGVAFILKDEKDILWRSGELFKAPSHWKWHKNMGWLGLPFLSSNHMKSTDDLMWDVTDGSLRVNLYEHDLLGNPHPFLPGPDGEPGGIAQIYALAKDRRTIYSNDYWVSTDWRRISCGPFRSRLKIQSLSSSASTMFVITEHGDMFTRFWNYNTSGASAPTNVYTLDPKQAKAGSFFTTRFIPTEPWFQQPPIPGEITDRITILSTGHAGNHARLLRVEGKQNQVIGYFEKLIFAEEWNFIPHGDAVQGTALNNKAYQEQDRDVQKEALLFPSQEIDLEGQFGIFTLRIHQMHLDCSPAYLEISYNDASVFLIAHTALKSPISSKKGNYYRKEGEVNSYKVYLELPMEYLEQKENPSIQKIVLFLENSWKNEQQRYFTAMLYANEESAIFKPKKSFRGLFSPGKSSMHKSNIP